MEKFGLAVKVDGEELLLLEIEVENDGKKVISDLPGSIRKLAESMAILIEENGNPLEEVAK
ncbi:hypothetical protein GCM10007416_35270 [Kroppenstedtia guangzhouensis]|uniref:Uncharacterized protein n=1 Tax=Kroppenstedtia guangzhouensis TaxID=1274356 RepID=A0ABQ1H589_9BACL|nr:hypothetical protein [Kroppenstedtia guangzhouensis]GGA59084.1 hypothetical protein GCM10007416_35270 [Kroppenstedtia guangzhouensis]